MAKNQTVIIKQGEINDINPKAGTTLKLGEHDGYVQDVKFTNAQDRQRDLEIKITINKDGKTTDTIVRIKNFFSSDFTKNISSFKDIIIDDESYTINGFIDGFEYSAADKKGVINGSAFNDTIYGTDGNDKIYTNGGEDTVYLSKGNDSIYGGQDADKYVINSEIGTTKIYNTTKDDILNFKNADSIRFEKNDNDLDINGVIIKDWFKKNNGQYGKMLSEVWDKEGNPNYINENTTILQDYRPENRGQKIIGINNMNSEIQGSDYNDKISSNTLSDTIYGNGGNDTIYANAKGNNETTIAYKDATNASEEAKYSPANIGNDTIYLNMKSDGTNTGSLKLDIAGLSYDSLAENGVFVERKGNDIIIKMDNANGVSGSLTLKDYLKTKKTVFLDNDRLKTIADFIKEHNENLLNIDFSTSKKGQTINGTWFDDTITGSNKNDKIYTNGGNDVVTAGKGNDIIYVDGGNVTLNFNKGDGFDTVYLRKPNDLEKLTLDFGETNSIKGYERSANGRDLLINYEMSAEGEFIGKYDRIIIKDFFKLDEDVRDRICYKYQGSENVLLDDYEYIAMFGKTNSSSKITDSMYRDVIFAGNKNDTIISNGGIDEITGNKGNDRIILAGADDKELLFQNGDGADTIITKDLHNATISVDNFNYMDSGFKAYKTADGDIIVGDFGGYATEKESYKNQTGLSFDDYSSVPIEYGKTYDISNSKMFFEKFLKNNEMLGENKNNLSFAGINNVDFDELGEYITKANGESRDSDTMKKIEAFIGTDKDDYIIAGNKNDLVDGGAGDDVIVVNKGKHYVIGGEGEDTLVVKNIGSLNYVSGVETIQYNGKLSDLYFAFNVDSEGNILEEQGFGIGNSSIYNQLTNAKFKNGTWFEYETPEELIVADKNGLNAQEVDFESIKGIIAENVGKYLSTKGYSSALDLLQNEQGKSMKALKKDIDGLIKIYKQGISGNDTITANEEHYELLQAGAGNDTYKITNNIYTYNDVTIDDLSGKNDTLELTDVEKDDVHIMAGIKLKTNKKGNVIRDKKGNVQYTVNGDLYLSSDFDNDEKGMITIKNYFKNGKIENIKLGDGTTYNVNARLQEIAQWLADNNFTSLDEAFEYNSEATLRYLNGVTAILSNNKAETIGTEIADLNQLRESVAGWIAGNDFADVNEVFQNDKKAGDIEALVSAFNNVNRNIM